MVLRGDRPGDGSEPTSLGPLRDGGQHAGLADPGVAGEQEELAAAGDRLLEPPIRELEQFVTPYEERAADGSWGSVHGRESRPHP